MIRLNSIKFKSVVYTLLILIVPLALLGVLSTFYYQNVIKQNIQNDCLEEAKTVSALTANYLDRALLYLYGQTESSRLIDAVSERRIDDIDTLVERTEGSNSLFYWVFVTDESGNVLSSEPYSNYVGKIIDDKPYVSEPLRTGKPYISGPVQSNTSGKPAIFISIPIAKNGSNVGVLVGALDQDQYQDIIYRIESGVPYEYIYVVDSSGQIVVHNNRDYMRSSKNFSELQIIGNLKNGGEGVGDYENTIQGGRWLGAYSPVRDYNWGAVVSLPLSEAYRPVNNAIIAFLGILIFLSILAAGIAYLVSRHITKPISSISAATEVVGKDADVHDYLSYDRDDELGRLARSFNDMSDRIAVAREKLVGEKKRSDLYIDIMGHDINNLNQVIMSNVEMLQQTEGLSDRQKEYLTGVILAIDDSANLIKNVKAIQIIASESQETTDLDINDIILGCINEIHPPDDKKVTFKYQPQKGLIIKAMPIIKLTFCNVVENSVKHSGPAVTIDINVNDTYMNGRKFYETRITDNGVGIPESIKGSLFTRFQQGPAMLPGRGLGLFSAKMIAEKFGGLLRIEDRVPGDYTKGTIVVIALPVAEGR